MPRKPRVDIPGFYHVLNRGVEQRVVFFEKEDFKKFEELLCGYANSFEIDLHSFSLMNNHYHLLLETKNDELSKFMRQINMNYAIYFNKKYKRSGHLWQGRYRSWYITDEAYLYSLILYIEQNPLKAKIIDNIDEYPYQSAYYILNDLEIPLCLKNSWIVKNFSSKSEIKDFLNLSPDKDTLKELKKTSMMVEEAKKVIAPLTKKNQLIFISEWGPAPERGKVYDSRLAGAHLVAVSRTMVDSPVDLMLAFEIQDGKGGSKWHGGWGMFTNPEYGVVVAKPRWRAYQMLQSLGSQRLKLIGEGSFVKALASRDKEGRIKILVVNYDSRGRHSEVFPLVITGLKDGSYSLRERYLSGRKLDTRVEVVQGQLKRSYALDPNEVVLVELKRL